MSLDSGLHRKLRNHAMALSANKIMREAFAYELHQRGWTYREISEFFGVSRTRIGQMVERTRRQIIYIREHPIRRPTPHLRYVFDVLDAIAKTTP